jgi:hypothetical protein
VNGPESADRLDTYYDFQGQAVRLTRRQWSHALERHSYLNAMQRAVRETLQDPDEVRKSFSDPDSTKVYYKWYTDTRVGDKWLCVVVKFLENDAFVLTAYETDNIIQES